MRVCSCVWGVGDASLEAGRSAHRRRGCLIASPNLVMSTSKQAGGGPDSALEPGGTADAGRSGRPAAVRARLGGCDSTRARTPPPQVCWHKFTRYWDVEERCAHRQAAYQIYPLAAAERDPGVSWRAVPVPLACDCASPCPCSL